MWRSQAKTPSQSQDCLGIQEPPVTLFPACTAFADPLCTQPSCLEKPTWGASRLASHIQQPPKPAAGGRIPRLGTPFPCERTGSGCSCRCRTASFGRAGCPSVCGKQGKRLTVHTNAGTDPGFGHTCIRRQREGEGEKEMSFELSA